MSAPASHETRASRLVPALIVIGLWLLLMISYRADEVVSATMWGQNVQWLRVLSQVMIGTTLWTILTPPLIYFVRRLNVPAGPAPRHAVQLLLLVTAVALVRTTMGVIAGVLVNSRPFTWESFARAVAMSTQNHIIDGTLCVAAILLYDFGRAARDRERLRAELAAAQLQQLRSRLRPHFLFNALNSIATLVHRDPHAADRMVTSLSGLLRSSLDLDERQEVTLAEELGFAREYLAIQKVRFEERLAIDMRVDDDVLRCAVPSLVLQPLVENAITHGIGRMRDGGRVEIAARRDGAMLILEVRNSGGADPTSIVHGVGLANVTGRLAALYGDRASLSFRRDQGWFVAAIALPSRELSR